ncbi:MAG: N-acetyltransferase [Candidatus Eremiobacteraeota bacterium]|nr:N-acetyltransferase [Candidatus Eremiobacteraeota bacterium]
MSVHETAIIEDGVKIGPRSAVWDNVHVRSGAQIGHDCIVGEKTYIAPGVRIGNFVKINAFVYICTGVEIEDGVMVSAGAIFTNDRFPRAMAEDFKALRSSQADEKTLATHVRRGATIGAGAVIGCGIEIGAFSMVGMGSVVTHSVAPHHLVLGNPARLAGCVCSCGQLLHHFDGESGIAWRGTCTVCSRSYETVGTLVKELTTAI